MKYCWSQNPERSQRSNKFSNRSNKFPNLVECVYTSYFAYCNRQDAPQLQAGKKLNQIHLIKIFICILRKPEIVKHYKWLYQKFEKITQNLGYSLFFSLPFSVNWSCPLSNYPVITRWKKQFHLSEKNIIMSTRRWEGKNAVYSN